MRIGIVGCEAPPRVNGEVAERISPILRPDLDLLVLLVGAGASAAYALADAYRERGVKVVMGGLRVRLRPWEALAHADSVVLGDLEETWPRIVRDLENGVSVPVYD